MELQTIVIVRADPLPEQTGASATQRDWANAVRTPVGGCNLQPQETGDGQDSAAVTTSGRWLLHKRGRLDLLPTDRVEYDGMTLEVDGIPKAWPDFDGGWHHTEAILVEESLHRASSGVDAVSAARTSAVGAASRTWSPR